MTEAEIGRFLFGLKVVKLADGSLKYRTQSVTQGIPVEIVIMQLRAFLRTLERDYFKDFERGTS